MRFGIWRGLSVAAVLLGMAASGRSVLAGDFHKAIPREVLAYDYRTGGVAMAPPIPYGHYAKDKFGTIAGAFGGLKGKLCGLCGGKGCVGCGGSGLLNGLHGLGNGLGGLGHGGGCSDCGDSGHGWGHGGLGLGLGHKLKGLGLCKDKGCDVCSGSPVLASGQGPAPVASPQASPQGGSYCGDKGCKLGKGHSHFFGGGSDLCGSCGGGGCGKCGLFNGLGGWGKGGCGACGGAGCGKCGLGLGGLGHGGLGLGSKLGGLLHKQKVKYFVGPGGPVPITPGYVPYVVPTRSPRDFLAFPPYTP